MTEHQTKPKLDFRCDKCNEGVIEPGGLAFSPPDTENVVRKYHLCARCWKRFVAWLTFNDNFHPGYD